MRFCGGCGSQLGIGTGYGQSGQYPPQGPYQQPQAYPQPYTSYPQPYPQQAGYQQQPMIGQGQMIVRCPVCMAQAPVGTSNCVSCRTSLTGVVPTPAFTPNQGQQGGIGGMLQGNNGKIAMGVLGGAAAVIGGEMLLHGVENSIEDRVEGDMGYGRHHNRHHRNEGLLGGLGELADDIGLI
ncbi:hypothetical protein KTT_24260 [Tengunoibacter tsumagoiensis]|uniref:DZANK-type domain-containing protein n=2 Tax=Tengunoibacter tsumagoiensis TaxID=2014871 RepID=A0A402A084_9CHLR|nr:hypothetical protein KTT_24260 [Tengunoibacter tsumagoiensis]